MHQSKVETTIDIINERKQLIGTTPPLTKYFVRKMAGKVSRAFQLGEFVIAKR